MSYFARMFAWFLTGYWRWRIRRAAAVIPILDKMMTKAGYARHERRQFWREFAGRVKVRAASCEKMVQQ
ncbi:MAG: hypothetical protein WC551_09215 [Patescibacteria group bacterium]